VQAVAELKLATLTIDRNSNRNLASVQCELSVSGESKAKTVKSFESTKRTTAQIELNQVPLQ
jgi:hypothetical protein